MTRRWSKRDSNRWSPTKRVPFTTILIDLRPFSSANSGGALAGRDHGFESLLLRQRVCVSAPAGPHLTPLLREVEAQLAVGDFQRPPHPCNTCGHGGGRL